MDVGPRVDLFTGKPLIDATTTTIANRAVSIEKCLVDIDISTTFIDAVLQVDDCTRWFAGRPGIPFEMYIPITADFEKKAYLFQGVFEGRHLAGKSDEDERELVAECFKQCDELHQRYVEAVSRPDIPYFVQ